MPLITAEQLNLTPVLRPSPLRLRRGASRSERGEVSSPAHPLVADFDAAHDGRAADAHHRAIGTGLAGPILDATQNGRTADDNLP
ncbi:MAG: hypothetical protein KAU50_04930, partial [Candidatus Marinimicrobia bacterium]|nr:hypothetical protein [Candidatus Neomarinimicrobiota bacterium]